MSTRKRILDILFKSNKPLGPKIIASELKMTNANIRKILSNLYKEKKITKVGYGEYISSVNVKIESVNVPIKSVNVRNLEAKRLMYREMWKYRKASLQRLKINDPEAYEKMRKTRREYYKRWRARNPDYNKIWLRNWRKKHPEKQSEYQIRYWLKRSMSENKGY